MEDLWYEVETKCPHGIIMTFVRDPNPSLSELMAVHRDEMGCQCQPPATAQPDAGGK